MASVAQLLHSDWSVAGFLRATAFVLVVITLIVVVLAYYRPHILPFVASRMSKLGLLRKPKTLSVINLQKTHFPEGTFSVRLTCGDEKFQTKPASDGAFPDAVYLTLPPWCHEVMIEVFEAKSRAAKGTVLIATLLRGTAVPVQLQCTDGFRKWDGDQFLVQLKVGVVSAEDTPLLASLGEGELGNAHLQAAVAQKLTMEATETGALMSVLAGPLRCIGSAGGWAHIELRRIDMETGPARRMLCLHEDYESRNKEPLLVIPVASIASVKMKGRGGFQVRVYDPQGGLKTLDFQSDPRECEVWAGGLRALSRRAMVEEGLAKARCESESRSTGTPLHTDRSSLPERRAPRRST